MTEDRNTLQLISDITEFNDLHDFMKDEHYSVKESIDKLVDALKYVVRYNS